MRTVWKFPIVRSPQEITAPGLILRHLALQGNVVTVWGEVSTYAAERTWVVTIVPTGGELNGDDEYVGTLQESPFVWHYYARLAGQ